MDLSLSIIVAAAAVTLAWVGVALSNWLLRRASLTDEEIRDEQSAAVNILIYGLVRAWVAVHGSTPPSGASQAIFEVSRMVRDHCRREIKLLAFSEDDITRLVTIAFTDLWDQQFVDDQERPSGGVPLSGRSGPISPPTQPR